MQLLQWLSMAGCVYGTQTHQHAEREGVHNPSQNILADELSSKPKNFAAILPSPLAQLEVASVPYPECRDEELIIKNHVVAINPVDWKIQSPMGRNFNLTYPVILGEDVAGEVVEVGTKAKSKFAVGDRVMAHPLGLGNGAAYGGFQLYPVLKAATVSKIPDSLTFKEAAVLPLSTSTAAAGLFMKSTLGMNYPPVNPGRSKAVKRSALLVWGCSSSVGSSVVQLADAAGYYLITTASPSNHEYCKALGADHVLNYHDTDIVKQIIDHFGGKKIVGVYDAIGSDITVRQSATVLHTLGGGKIASVGLAPDVFSRDGLAPLLEDDEVEAYVANSTTARSASPSKRVRLAYDPIQPEKVWIAQTIVKVGVPMKVKDYEESLRNPKKLVRQKTKEKLVRQKTKEKQAAAANKVASKKPTVRGKIPTATDIFLQITNPVSEAPASSACYSPSKPSHSSSQPPSPALTTPPQRNAQHF